MTQEEIEVAIRQLQEDEVRNYNSYQKKVASLNARRHELQQACQHPSKYDLMPPNSHDPSWMCETCGLTGK